MRFDNLEKQNCKCYVSVCQMLSLYAKCYVSVCQMLCLCMPNVMSLYAKCNNDSTTVKLQVFPITIKTPGETLLVIIPGVLCMPNVMSLYAKCGKMSPARIIGTKRWFNCL